MDIINSFSRTIHREWDEMVERLGWGSDKPVFVANYTGYGRADYLHLTGRVLRDKAVSRTERDGLLRNVVNNFKRFNSREIPGAEVEVTWQGNTFKTTTDAEGYFKIEEHFAAPYPLDTNAGPWQEAKISVVSIPGKTSVDYHTFTRVSVPQQAEFGIISDIDDTVLQTDVTSRLKLRTMWHTIMKNAGNRRAFARAAEFYQALQLGPEQAGENPVFYLSNSPWNLYDLLTDFLSINHFPRGPVLLRDFGLPYEERPEEYQGHKVETLQNILRAYPNLNFILLGDSGEHDTHIYLATARKFPGRIKQIYIRDVQHNRRARRIKKLVDENSDIPVRIIASYEEAEEHARKHGYIA